MSQFGARGHPQGQVNVPKSPGGLRTVRPNPEDSAYLQPTAGYSSSSGASTGSVGGRTLNEYDSGVADVDGVNLSDRSGSGDNYIKAQRSPPPGSVPTLTRQEAGWGGKPAPLGTAANPHPPVSSAQSQPGQPQQGIMKRPESLARNHEYEELPSARYHNPVEYSYTDMDSNNSQPRTPAMERLVSGNGSTQSGASGDSRDLYFDTNHNDRPPSAYRKRENPLYDSADQVRQSTVEEKSSKPSLCSCPFIIIIFFSIVAVCAFILAALAISGIGVSTTREATLVTPSSHLQKALERIETLEQHYANLLEKLNQVSVDAEEIQRLKANVTAQNIKIQQLEDRIEVIRTTTNNNIMRFEKNVTSRLDTISKTPGPPGAGNLSACEHRKLSFGGSSDIPQSYTSYFPNTIAEFNQWALMGVECAVSGGTYSAVEVSESQGFKQFRCNCSGKTSASNRFCYMHYWRCPRIS